MSDPPRGDSRRGDDRRGPDGGRVADDRPTALDRETAVDAGLAALCLVGAVLAGRRADDSGVEAGSGGGTESGVESRGDPDSVAGTGFSPSPRWVAAGGAGTLAAEFALGRRATTVRRAWARPATKLGAVGVAAVLGVAGPRVAPRRFPSAAAGAAATYLAVLGAVAAGVLAPPSAWGTDRDRN